ncbi:MAG TPA: uroporphyrinogen-III synthase [Thermohalobaculum sp.]|nr:uroporphyrinogen-III synthase [Thermohalobaculum sp.]
MSVLLTRPEAESREIAGELARHGVESLLWPLTRIERCPGPVVLPEDTEGILFTSANAVRAFAEARAERGLPALCVGARTARLARECGFAEVRCADGDAAALVELAAEAGFRRLFHPRGRDAAADLSAVLAPHGLAVTDQVVYAAEPTGPPPPAVARALAAGAVRVVTLWSARNARLLAECWRRAPPGPLSAVAAAAISARAAEPLDGLGFGSISIADRPDRPSMIRLILGSALRR